MSYVKTELPPEEQLALVELHRKRELAALHQRVLALRNAGWTLQIIADTCSVTRGAVRYWQLEADPNGDLPEVAAPVRPVKTVVRNMYPQVPDEEVPRLRELAAEAQKYRGWATAAASVRDASLRLDVLMKYYIDRGVPTKHVANAVGLTFRGVAARLERRLVTALETKRTIEEHEEYNALDRRVREEELAGRRERDLRKERELAAKYAAAS